MWLLVLALMGCRGADPAQPEAEAPALVEDEKPSAKPEIGVVLSPPVAPGMTPQPPRFSVRKAGTRRVCWPATW